MRVVELVCLCDATEVYVCVFVCVCVCVCLCAAAAAFRYNELGSDGAANLSSLGGLTGLQTLHLG